MGFTMVVLGYRPDAGLGITRGTRSPITTLRAFGLTAFTEIAAVLGHAPTAAGVEPAPLGFFGNRQVGVVFELLELAVPGG